MSSIRHAQGYPVNCVPPQTGDFLIVCKFYWVTQDGARYGTGLVLACPRYLLQVECERDRNHMFGVRTPTIGLGIRGRVPSSSQE